MAILQESNKELIIMGLFKLFKTDFSYFSDREKNVIYMLSYFGKININQYDSIWRNYDPIYQIVIRFINRGILVKLETERGAFVLN